jgi:glyoxylase-like metal-dependent hydrolase (beta-lactamase superfamily II)
MLRTLLPSGVTVLERGWLSSNCVVLQGQGGAGHALVDSGYCTHAPQTLVLLHATLQCQPLALLVNTHLHSDHCGGNAALQAAHPGLRTFIPPGHAQQVQQWDLQALSYVPTGQQCPRFGFDDVLLPGSEITLGQQRWQVHAAPGHDAHAVILFEPESRTLISGDALWERGFGVVFPELDGEEGFDEMAGTLDVVQALRPALVVPGHGAPFSDVAQALAVARERLNGFVANPARHARYAAKVLLKFKLLEAQHMARTALVAWASTTPYCAVLFRTHFAAQDCAQVVDELVADLVRAQAARVEGDSVFNA